MRKKPEIKLTRREEQIMGVIFRLGEASVSDIMKNIPNSPTSGAVRRMLNVLYARDLVEYKHDGARKVYSTKVKSNIAGEKALNRVVETFFAGSAAKTMASLFSNQDIELSNEDKKMLLKLIKKTKEKGR